MTRTCPSCGADAPPGPFCASCGAAVGASSCSSCGNTLPAGAQFCNQCGTPAGGAAHAAPAGSRPAAGVSRLPWALTSVAVLALLAVVVVPRLGRDHDPAVPSDRTSPQAAAPAPVGDPSAIDISSMTPRERADRLFNRVMQSVSSGDTAQASAFLPMALAAYAQVPELDLDGRYHLAVLHLVDGDAAAARAQADSILQADPGHLFGLFTAAQAEDALGDEAVALSLYRDFLDNYGTEIERELPEYTDHAQVLPVNRAEAERRVEGS